MMGYWKYMAREAKDFFRHGATILGVGIIILLLARILVPFEDTLKVIAVALLHGVLSLLLIWILYMIIGYFLYRRTK